KSLSEAFRGFCSRRADRGMAKSLTPRAMIRSGFDGSLVARKPRCTSVPTTIARIDVATRSVIRTTFTGFIQISRSHDQQQTKIPRFKPGSILCQSFAARDELLLAPAASSTRITGLKRPSHVVELRKVMTMFRILASVLLVFASQAFAQVPVEQLAKPPANARIWTITSSGGAARHGQVSMWTSADGTHWSRFSMNLRGFVFEVDEQNRFAPDGQLTSMIVRGKVPEGDAAETYEVKDGAYSFKSPVDHGTGAARAGLEYVAFGGTLDSIPFILDHLLKASTREVDLLPSGRAKLELLTTLEVSNGSLKKTLTCYGITGFGLSPQPVWMDGTTFFGQADILSFLPQGWEKVEAALSKAQDEALAKRAPALAAQIARPVQGALAFRNVKLYDADARKFRDGMTVVIADGKVLAVGPTSTTEVPTEAQVVEGTGKTLIPGLWDNHQHYGDDSTGPLLLATGITSVRDPGNQ